MEGDDLDRIINQHVSEEPQPPIDMSDVDKRKAREDEQAGEGSNADPEGAVTWLIQKVPLLG